MKHCLRELDEQFWDGLKNFQRRLIQRRDSAPVKLWMSCAGLPSSIPDTEAVTVGQLIEDLRKAEAIRRRHVA